MNRTFAFPTFTFLIAALLATAWWLPHSAALFATLFPALERPVYLQEPLLDLLLQHVALVGVSSAGAVVLGTLAGVLTLQPVGRPFSHVVQAIASLGQAVPPVAVLALAVPVVGFGDGPALVALCLYGLLPVVQATRSGLLAVPQDVRSAALAMGMSRWEIFKHVDVPLALPVWLSGVRLSTIINIGTATVASTVGAKSLGTPIVVGLSGFNTAYVIQGALLVGLLAVTVDVAFEAAARRVRWSVTEPIQSTG
jgi:osmoprotectant transport system permease protein